MKKTIVAGILSMMLVSLGGCYWPGYWHDRHHHDRYEYYDHRYDRYDSYRDRGDFHRR